MRFSPCLDVLLRGHGPAKTAAACDAPGPVAASGMAGFRIPDTPCDTAFGPDGRIHVKTRAKCRLFVIRDERDVGSIGRLFVSRDTAEPPDGGIRIACPRNRRPVGYNPDLGVFQARDQPEFRFLAPRPLDADPQGLFAVADCGAHHVVPIDPGGPQGGKPPGQPLGDGSPGTEENKFDDPKGVPLRGNVHSISDPGNNRVVRQTIVIN